MKVNTLVGISGADTDDLADEWSRSGLGPAIVRVTPGTSLTMQFDKSLDDRQANAEPCMLSSRPFFLLAEHVENVRQELGWNPDSGVADGNLDAGIDPFEPQLDLAVLWSEFDGIR